MENQQDFDSYVATNFRWNFGANVMDIAFYMLGMSFVSSATILPLLVSKLTDSKLAIGLIPAIYSLGFLLPQLLTANFTERLRYKKWFVVLVSGPGERGPWLLMGLIVWAFAIPYPTLTLLCIYAGLAVAMGSAGTANPAWTDLIAKVIPVQKRGRWAGVAWSLGALLGIGGAALAGRMLANYPYSKNFGLCFLAASVALFFSWVGLALNREPAGLIVKPHITLSDYLRQLPHVLRRNTNYSHFLISRSVAALGGMAAGFFMVYGFERFGLSGRDVGLLTAVFTGSQAVANPLWGLLGDRAGHKVVLVGAAFCMMLATGVALITPVAAGMYVVFALNGAAWAADSVSAQNVVMEFAAPDERPTYIGLSNTLQAPARALAPIIGGLLATVLGYRGMFPVAILLAGVGGLMLALWVHEPRHLQPHTVAPATTQGG